MSGALAVEAASGRLEPAGRRRWLACAAVAAMAHLALAWVLTRQPEPVRPPGAPPPTVLVDLAPPPAPPPAPAVDLPVPELPELTPELTPPEPPPEPVPPEPVLELPLPELPPPPELALPEPPPEAPPDAAVLPALPPPRAKPTPPREIAGAEPAPPVAAPAPVAPAAAPAPSPAEPAAAAPPSYQGLLLRHLERHKRYPRSARLRREEGTTQLRFTMDRAGNVLGYQVVRSSGHESLDAEVTAMLERAAPLPPLPAEMPQARLELIVPVAFELR